MHSVLGFRAKLVTILPTWHALNNEKIDNRNFRIYGTAYAKINFTRDLNFNTSIGGDFMSAEDHVYYTSEHMYGNSAGGIMFFQISSMFF